MPKRDLNKTKKKIKKKTETVVVKGTVTKEQKKVIKSLVGSIGSNEQDVVGKIITIWLYNEGMLKRLIEQKHNL